MKAKRVFLFLCIFTGVLALAFGVWTRVAEEHAHFTPQYEQVNLADIWQQETLSAEDYLVLQAQTGVGQEQLKRLRAREAEQRQTRDLHPRIGAEQGQTQDLSGDRMAEQTDTLQTLETLQKRFFAEVEIECEPNTILSREEHTIDNSYDFQQAFPFTEEGDILVTFSCHAGGWRCGHAGLVVDVTRGHTLEARVLGTDSALVSAGHWTRYPSVAVLRVKGLGQEERAAVAEHGRKNMRGVPYRLLCGKEMPIQESTLALGSDFLPEGTHCAHLIWTVYARVGFDLDEDEGWIVTPGDIFRDEDVEIVQLYGLDPKLFHS